MQAYYTAVIPITWSHPIPSTLRNLAWPSHISGNAPIVLLLGLAGSGGWEVGTDRIPICSPHSRNLLLPFITESESLPSRAEPWPSEPKPTIIMVRTSILRIVQWCSSVLPSWQYRRWKTVCSKVRIKRHPFLIDINRQYSVAVVVIIRSFKQCDNYLVITPSKIGNLIGKLINLLYSVYKFNSTRIWSIQ